jgi:hypothetical protein
MSRAEKFSRGFIVSDRNFDIKFGWAALEWFFCIGRATYKGRTQSNAEFEHRLIIFSGTEANNITQSSPYLTGNT